MKVKLLALITIVLLFTGCNYFQQDQYQGYIEGDNVYLASPYSGILEKLMVARGEKVSQGQLLYRLDANPEMLIVEQTKASLDQAKKTLADLKAPRRPPEIRSIEQKINQVVAELKLAEIRLERRRTLYKKEVINKDSVDAAQSQYDSLVHQKKALEEDLSLAKEGSRQQRIDAQQALVASTKYRLEEAKWRLLQKKIYAPDNGEVFDTFFQEGEFVGSQQPVLAILPPKNLRVEFFIPANKLKTIQYNQSIKFQCYGCDKKSEATISYISPKAEYIPPLVYSRENTDKLVFRVKARIKKPDNFKLGQPVTVTIP